MDIDNVQRFNVSNQKLYLSYNWRRLFVNLVAVCLTLVYTFIFCEQSEIASAVQSNKSQANELTNCPGVWLYVWVWIGVCAYDCLLFAQLIVGHMNAAPSACRCCAALLSCSQLILTFRRELQQRRAVWRMLNVPAAARASLADSLLDTCSTRQCRPSGI